MTRAGSRWLLALVCAGLLLGVALRTQVNTARELAAGVYFHEGDLSKGHCNNGWVIFEDYVLVLDANYPSGAREIMPKIRALTDRPIRFAFDTHHHGDHAYANQIWVDSGATPVAHEGVIAEMKKYETGLFGGKPGRWEGEARERSDMKDTRLKAPTLLYRDVMIFDDGKHRVELRWFGVAHTYGDGFAWLPNERILFSGDAAVNGPYNYVGDGDSAQWVETLRKAQQLGAKMIAPGHGPVGDGSLLEEQRQFFVALRSEVEKRKTMTPEAMQKDVGAILSALRGKHAKYLASGAGAVGQLEAQVAHVYKEITGKVFPVKTAMVKAARDHATSHGGEEH